MDKRKEGRRKGEGGGKCILMYSKFKHVYLTVAIFVQVKNILPAVPFIDLEINRQHNNKDDLSHGNIMHVLYTSHI